MCMVITMGNLHSNSQVTHIKELAILLILNLPELSQTVTFRAQQVPGNITHLNQFLVTN